MHSSSQEHTIHLEHRQKDPKGTSFFTLLKLLLTDGQTWLLKVNILNNKTKQKSPKVLMPCGYSSKTSPF